jgi:predicted phosphate transport protein (TIGR00153 family)
MMPREGKFFELFDQHAERIAAGSRELAHMMANYGNLDARQAGISAIDAIEKAADKITHETVALLHKTFITPFDRSDIIGLIGDMDDAIDQMQQTAKAITLYEVTEFDPQMREMGDLIVRAAHLTVEIVGALQFMRRDAAKLTQLTQEMVRLEEQTDQLHDEGLKRLFVTHRHSDPMAFIVGTEIYSHLEKVADRFEDVANRVNGIVIEHL